MKKHVSHLFLSLALAGVSLFLLGISPTQAQVNFGVPNFSRPGAAVPGAPGAAAKKSMGLALNTGWNRKPTNKIKTADMVKLFDGIAAAYDPKPAEGQTIWGDVTYLMPLKEAMEAIGQTAVTSRQTVSTPCLPVNSLFYRTWKGEFTDDGFSFDRIVLMTDAKDQAVAVMLMMPSPKLRMFQPHKHTTSWNLFNLVLDRSKANRSWRIHHEREDSVTNIVLSSEIIDDRTIPREQLRLFLPNQISGIAAGLTQKARK